MGAARRPMVLRGILSSADMGKGYTRGLNTRPYSARHCEGKNTKTLQYMGTPRAPIVPLSNIDRGAPKIQQFLYLVERFSA